jgi:hypothetical protein
MSGAAEVLGIIAGCLALVKTIAQCADYVTNHQIWKEAPKAFREIRVWLPLFGAALAKMEMHAKSSSADAYTSTALLAVVKECWKLLSELKDKLHNVTHGANSWQVARARVASLFRESRVKEIADSLERCATMLTFECTAASILTRDEGQLFKNTISTKVVDERILKWFKELVVCIEDYVSLPLCL